MPAKLTIVAGQSVRLQLGAGDSVLVESDPSCEGSVEVTQIGAGSGGTSGTVTSTLSPQTIPFGPLPMTRTFGPFAIGAFVVVACTKLTANYTITRGGVSAENAVELNTLLRKAKQPVAPPKTCWFKLDEKTGTTLIDTNITNNSMTIQGVATGAWGQNPGLSSNGTLTAVETQTVSQLREIMNLRSMVPGQTQLLVSFLLTHPTVPTNAPLIWWGVSASNGWGLEVNASTLWIDFVTRAAGSSAVKVTDTERQGKMRLPYWPDNVGPGVVTQSALCFEIIRSAAAPGQYEINVFRQAVNAPAYSDPEIDTVVCTADELHNGATNLPSWTNSGALTLFGRPNADQSTMVSIAPAGYSIANLVIQRRNAITDTLGRRVAINQRDAALAGAPYVFPITE